MQQILDSSSKFLPELILTATLCVTILVNLIFRRQPKLIPAIAFIGTAIAGLFAAMQSGSMEMLYFGMVVIDGFAVFFKIVITIATLFIILFSVQSRELAAMIKTQGEYYALIIAMTLGMFLTVSASNVLMLVLSIEVMGLSSYILTGYTKAAPDSSEASLKYIIYGALSTGIMLYGISLLFGITGALGYYDINRVLMSGDFNHTMLLVSTILIVVGLGYKISAVPFHFWTPDVYEGAPITITAYLSVASKAAGFAAMIRFFKVVFMNSGVALTPIGVWTNVQNFEWNIIIAIVAILTMTVGNIVAIWQDNLKRLLAYSSIAHAGYMLMGVVVLSDRGIAAVLIYFVIYLFMNLGAFYIVMLIADRTGSENIKDYRGLGFRSPMIAIALSIFLFSLTGLPPFAGFVGKLYLFSAVLEAKWLGLAIVGALNSVVSLYYYVRVVRNMYLREADDISEIKFPLAAMVTVLLLLVPIFILGLYFGPLVEIASKSVSIFGLN
jgi:NADH-quinone oxidoreductase subunit N